MLKLVKEKIRWMLYQGLYKPGHYYSTIPDLKDVMLNSEKIFEEKNTPGLDLKEEHQLKLLEEMRLLKKDFLWPHGKDSKLRYYSDNTFFNKADAFSLFCIIRLWQPKKIIEIGSGFSSALMVDTNELFFQNQINFTFIEPFPSRLNTLIKSDDAKQEKYTLLTSFIQDVDPSLFETLEENDILFVDSSHVSKIGSDLNFILFHILPKLKKGVIVHFHDIFFPLEYPKEWIAQGIYWNEIYLLRAFLMYNSTFEITLFNSFWNKKAIAGFEEFTDGGSLWIKKVL